MVEENTEKTNLEEAESVAMRAVAPYGSTLRFIGGRRVEVSGVDYGTRKITLHAISQDVVVLQVAGHSCREKFCAPEYVPTKMLVYRIIDRGDGTSMQVEPITGFPVRYGGSTKQ